MVHLLSTFVKYVRIWQNAYFRNTLGHAEELQYNVGYCIFCRNALK